MIYRKDVEFYHICILFMISLGYLCVAEKIQYISTERPVVTYFNPNYVSYVNLTSRRYGRNDPFYYVDFHMNVLRSWGNNVSVDYYFYQMHSYNVYKRSFLEMRFRFCDMIQKDMFFGYALKQGKLAQPCPYSPGEYHLYNMTIPVKHIPRDFPIRRGRIYCNLTVTDTNEPIGQGYIDMEVKEYNVKKKMKD